MIVRVAVLMLWISLSLTSCTRRWNPSTAEGDADRDIRAHKIRFCYIGGFVRSAPGIPEGEDPQRIYTHYGHIAVGPQDCVQDGKTLPARWEYARRYNSRMWTYVSSRP